MNLCPLSRQSRRNLNLPIKNHTFNEACESNQMSKCNQAWLRANPSSLEPSIRNHDYLVLLQARFNDAEARGLLPGQDSGAPSALLTGSAEAGLETGNHKRLVVPLGLAELVINITRNKRSTTNSVLEPSQIYCFQSWSPENEMSQVSFLESQSSSASNLTSSVCLVWLSAF